MRDHNETIQPHNRKTVVITGASSGMGKGVAIHLAKAGHRVVLAARRGELLDQLADACRGAGGEALAVPTDVSKKDQIEQLAQTAIQRFGRIDAWINDAGVAAIGKFEEVPLDHHEQVIHTNLCGVLHGSYVAITQFIRQGRGTLINLSSVLGKIPAPYYSSYVASKFGVAGLSAALRSELEARQIQNVHLCTVFPMATDTPFFDHAANYTGQEAQPVGPLYDPEKVIHAIIDLLDNPKEEVVMGGQGKFFNFLHSIAPGMVDAYMRQETQKSQMRDNPVAPETEGAVKSPTRRGRGVDGGRQKSSK